MKLIKRWAVALVMFVAAMASYGQSHVPTLQSNNNWTGANNFALGNLTLGNTTHVCRQGAGYYMIWSIHVQYTHRSNRCAG